MNIVQIQCMKNNGIVLIEGADKPISERESMAIKAIIKRLAELYPCEWDEALGELEIPKMS